VILIAKKQTVLIVDDVKTNITVLAELLQEDWDVRVAVNGESAINIATGGSKPDIILLDVMMPDMDGYEVCRRLKLLPETQDIPVIFITAMDQDEDEERGLKLGAIDYVTKPFKPAIVKARIKNHLELKNYRDFLKASSMIDGLTGIPNRRRFEEFSKCEWKRAARSRNPISVIMIDIDNFKNYNDTYGHLMGDDCLKSVADSINRSLNRPADLTARWGGEEFVCVLPDTDSQAAMRIAEIIRESVNKLNIPHKASINSSVVTISLGVASIIPETSLEFDFIMSKADKALYSSKNNGKNRVTLEN